MGGWVGCCTRIRVCLGTRAYVHASIGCVRLCMCLTGTTREIKSHSRVLRWLVWPVQRPSGQRCRKQHWWCRVGPCQRACSWLPWPCISMLPACCAFSRHVRCPLPPLLQGHVGTMAQDEWGHLVLITALSVVDDTALLKKFIVTDLQVGWLVRVGGCGCVKQGIWGPWACAVGERVRIGVEGRVERLRRSSAPGHMFSAGCAVQPFAVPTMAGLGRAGAACAAPCAHGIGHPHCMPRTVLVPAGRVTKLHSRAAEGGGPQKGIA